MVMSLIRKMRGHLHGTEILNEGLFFATCKRCRRDIIRQGGWEWDAVPAGVRVMWHPTGHHGVHWRKTISARAKIGVREATLPERRQAEGD